MNTNTEKAIKQFPTRITNLFAEMDNPMQKRNYNPNEWYPNNQPTNLDMDEVIASITGYDELNQKYQINHDKSLK